MNQVLSNGDDVAWFGLGQGLIRTTIQITRELDTWQTISWIHLKFHWIVVWTLLSGPFSLNPMLWLSLTWVLEHMYTTSSDGEGLTTDSSLFAVTINPRTIFLIFERIIA